jgi:hypothetical protein
MARAGPQTTPPAALELPPQSAPFVTRNSSPVKREKQTIKPTPKKARAPSQKRTKKPPSVTGYHWRREGVGWDLRKDIYVTGNNGEKKRKQPYVAHLSREAFGELKRKHKGAALERAIAQWIEERDR